MILVVVRSHRLHFFGLEKHEKLYATTTSGQCRIEACDVKLKDNERMKKKIAFNTMHSLNDTHRLSVFYSLIEFVYLRGIANAALSSESQAKQSMCMRATLRYAI